jgi:ligand-binding sensor domain-containing protein
LDDEGTVWFGTTNGILSASDMVLTDRTSEIGILDTLDVRSSAVIDGKVLFGTTSGQLIEYNKGKWNVYGKHFLGSAGGIMAIVSESPDIIWLGTENGGIIRHHGNKNSKITVSDGLPSNHVRALAIEDGTLWAVCYGGIAEIKTK